jgi:predicted transcriptional regulator
MPSQPFSVRFDEKLKARLDEIAAREDRSLGYLVQKAVEEFVEARGFFFEEMKRAEAEANKGVFTSWEKVKAWTDSWDTDHELPMPEPDIFPEKQT